jgi:hypothetical protein
LNQTEETGREFKVAKVVSIFSFKIFYFQNFQLFFKLNLIFRKKIKHEKFDDYFANDILLIKLAEKVDFRGREKHLRPINLTNKNLNTDERLDCLVSVWGFTKLDKSDPLNPKFIKKSFCCCN